jgi:tetratricopeptide (TPR) repeat protein
LLAQICRRLGDAEGEAREQAILAEMPDQQTTWTDPDVAAVLDLRRDDDAQFLAVERLAGSGQTSKAVALLARLSRQEARPGKATEQFVQSLLELERYREAELALREKLLQDADNESLRFQLGLALFLQDNYEAAAGEFRRVTELKPDKVDAHYNLGHALRKAGRDDEALEAFAATVRLSPSHAFARANLAELLIAANRPDEARPHLAVASRLAPDDPKVRELQAKLSE